VVRLRGPSFRAGEGMRLLRGTLLEEEAGVAGLEFVRLVTRAASSSSLFVARFTCVVGWFYRRA